MKQQPLMHDSQSGLLSPNTGITCPLTTAITHIFFNHDIELWSKAYIEGERTTVVAQKQSRFCDKSISCPPMLMPVKSVLQSVAKSDNIQTRRRHEMGGPNFRFKIMFLQ